MKTACKCFLILAACLTMCAATAGASQPWCENSPGVCFTNVNSRAMTISWTTTGHAETGLVQWGVAPGDLNKTANDDRGAKTSDESHVATITGLAPNTPYYFRIVSGGVSYDNSGTPWTTSTGLTLQPGSPHFMAVDLNAARAGESTVGAIVYVQAFSGSAESATISSVATKESRGVVLLDLNSLRTADNQAYFPWQVNDLSIFVDGRSAGYASYVGGVPERSGPFASQLALKLTACTGCFINGSCTENGAASPGGPEKICAAEQNRADWSVNAVRLAVATAPAATAAATAPAATKVASAARTNQNTNKRCLDDTSKCEDIFVSPKCPDEIVGPGVRIPVTIDRVDGEERIGFRLLFDPTLLTFVSYDLSDGVLETWENFDCKLSPARDEIDCAGDSDIGLAAADHALLATLVFDPVVATDAGLVEAGRVCEETDPLAIDGERTAVSMTQLALVIADPRSATEAPASMAETHSLAVNLSEGNAPAKERTAVFVITDLSGQLALMSGDSCETDVMTGGEGK
jgi:hypothetical protein